MKNLGTEIKLNGDYLRLCDEIEGLAKVNEKNKAARGMSAEVERQENNSKVRSMMFEKGFIDGQI